MNSYSLGFVFDASGKTAFVRKRRGPGGQKGKLNGFGGKRHGDEHPLICMIREYKEEADCDVLDWRFVKRAFGGGWEVFVYAAFVPSLGPFTGREKVEVFKNDAVAGIPRHGEKGFVESTYDWWIQARWCLDYSVPGLEALL